MSFRVGKDYYAIMGVPQSATDEEIRRAYRALARRYHPDSRTERAPTTLFHEVQEAYAVLGDPRQRREPRAGGRKVRRTLPVVDREAQRTAARGEPTDDVAVHPAIRGRLP